MQIDERVFSGQAVALTAVQCKTPACKHGDGSVGIDADLSECQRKQRPPALETNWKPLGSVLFFPFLMKLSLMSALLGESLVQGEQLSSYRSHMVCKQNVKLGPNSPMMWERSWF